MSPNGVTCSSWLPISGFLLVAALSACSGRVVGEQVPLGPCGATTDPCTVGVQPSTVTLRIGDTLAFRAILSPAVIDKRITWNSSDSSKIRVDSVGKAQATAATLHVAVCAGGHGITGCSSVAVLP